MPGLLRRAIQVRLSHSVRHHGQGDSGGRDDISEDERRELSEEIEKLFTGRKPIARNAGMAEDRKKGWTLPLLVNFFSVAILLFAVAGFRGFGKAGNGTESAATDAYKAAEALVIQEVKRQAESALSEKQNRITEIQAQLRELSRKPTGGFIDPSVRVLEAELSNLQADAEVRLRELSAQKGGREFFYRQIKATYEEVQARISSLQFSEALKSVAAADALLESQNVKSSPELSALSQSLGPANAVLRQVLQAQIRASETGKESPLALKLSEIENLVGKADESIQRGNEEDAVRLYSEALSSLDAVALAHDRLTSRIEKEYSVKVDSLSGKVGSLETTLSSLQETKRRQDRDLSLYKDRLEDLGKKLSDTTDLLEKQSRELSDLIAAVRLRVEDLSKRAGERAVSKAEVYDLLNTKLTLKEIVGSESVRNVHPDLYRDLDRFFQNYGDVYSELGRKQALEDISSSLAGILSSFPAPATYSNN